MAISAGAYHSLALTADGHVYAWGDNANGQLGNGSTTNATTPVEVKGTGGTGVLSNIQSLSAGYYFSLAVTDDGHVSTLGTEQRRPTGNGTTTDSSTPVAATGMANVSAAGCRWLPGLGRGMEGPHGFRRVAAAVRTDWRRVHGYGDWRRLLWGDSGGLRFSSGHQLSRSISPTSLTAVAPAGTGTVDVTVTTPGGVSPISVNDHYTYQAVPTVTGLSPTGPQAQGTVVTVTGTNLTGATAVNFGTCPSHRGHGYLADLAHRCGPGGYGHGRRDGHYAGRHVGDQLG